MKRAARGAWLAWLLLAPACAPDEAPAPVRVRLLRTVSPISIGAETRFGLSMQPAPGGRARRQRFDVSVPPGSQLDLGYGVPNVSLAESAAPVTFEVAVRRARGEREVLFERTLDPSRPVHRRWFDLRIDLSPYAGEELSLELAVAPEPGSDPPSHGAWSEPVLHPEGAEDERPSFLIVSLDTLRSRSVGTYGYGRDTTPFLDAYAARGALFENSITTSVTTAPSHMSLFTGLYPANHGLRTGLDWKAPSARTTARQLRVAGYQTAAFTENGYIMRPRGFGEGFATFTENKGDDRSARGYSRVTFGKAQRWLANSARPPFFLFVHTYEVHSPFESPNAYRDRFVGDGYAGPDEPPLRRARDEYDREIRYVDDKLRELMGVLELTGLAESTVVVILADHGEEFGEHGLYQHGAALFEEALRIPLVFVGPDIAPGRHAAQVSLIDVMPTLLELAGVASAERIDGISLVPALRGGAPLPDRTLFAEARAPRRWLRPRVGERWNPPLIAVRSQDQKFVVHRPEEGEQRPPVRFDLEADPLERNPLPVTGADRAAIDGLVDDYLTGRVDPSELRAPDSPESLDPELRERLRALGYLE